MINATRRQFREVNQKMEEGRSSNSRSRARVNAQLDQARVDCQLRLATASVSSRI